MSDVPVLAAALLLLLSANGAPILARNLFGGIADRPVDGDYVAADGRRLLGPTKTWRGVLAAVLVTALMAWLLAYPPQLGAGLALGAMAGDLLASFCKRRLGLAPSARARGLDQIPEAALPLWLMHRSLGIDWVEGLLIVLLFVGTDIVLSRLLYRLRIRRRPY